MAIVVVEGVFMGANVKSSTYEGNTKTSLLIDVYQPKSELSDKMIQLKTDDIGLLSVITSEYDMGSIFKANATVNAYQNKAYFKLLNVIEAS